MQTWEAIFVVVACVAIVLQALVLVAIYAQMKALSAVLMRVANDLDARLSPLLGRLDRLVEESHGQMSEIVRDTAEIMRMVKSNGQRFDRVLEEAADRLRLQVIQVDRLLTGALETIEDTGAELKRSLVEPMRTATALVKGVRAGVEFFRGRSRVPQRRRDAQDEGLFI